jgi:hypothetical protein
MSDIKSILDSSLAVLTGVRDKLFGIVGGVWDWCKRHWFLFFLVFLITSPVWLAAAGLASIVGVAYLCGIVVVMPFLLVKGIKWYACVIFNAFLSPLKACGIVDVFGLKMAWRKILSLVKFILGVSVIPMILAAPVYFAVQAELDHDRGHPNDPVRREECFGQQLRSRQNLDSWKNSRHYREHRRHWDSEDNE